ncbi:MAG: histidinol-phosphate transaminase [Verrucomicrobia bacterium]|nr:histidinol-phosphate transaminase [Verrucomicrobiota bacterium]MDA1086099.1 histidinol-phosphate transaminase [Verrucomicrobiota bacterium]
MTTFSDTAHSHIPNLPLYEPGRPLEEVSREFGFEAATADKLASNENALGPSPLALEAIRQHASRMHLYPDGAAFDLTRALAGKLDISPESIIAANGSNEIIELLGHVFLGPGTNVVMGERAFVVYRLVANLFQADVISVPMPDHVHDLCGQARALTPQTRLVYVANPNNPTGTVVDPEALHAFVRGLPDHVVAVLDEAYIELLPKRLQPDVLRYVREGRRVVIMRTFSKTYGLAGLRIGYAVAPPDLIQLLQRVRQPFNVNAMAQAAAIAALGDEEHVERTRELVQSGLARFQDAFEDLGLPYIPSVANFICVEVGAGRSTFEKLQARGIIVRPMDVYGMPRHIRITVGLPEQNERCLAALEECL